MTEGRPQPDAAERRSGRAPGRPGTAAERARRAAWRAAGALAFLAAQWGPLATYAPTAKAQDADGPRAAGDDAASAPAAPEPSPASAAAAPPGSPRAPAAGSGLLAPPPLEDLHDAQERASFDLVPEPPARLRGPDLELFGAHGLDGLTRNEFGLGLGVAAHVEVMLWHWLGVVGGASWLALSSANERPGASWWGTRLGLRLHWTDLVGLADRFDGWIDVMNAFGRSGGVTRHGIDFGTGFSFRMGPDAALAAGPFLRLRWARDPLGNDPWLLLFGLNVSLLPPKRTFRRVEREDAHDLHHARAHREGYATPVIRQARRPRDREPVVFDLEAFGMRNFDLLGQDQLTLGAGTALHAEIIFSRHLGVHIGGAFGFMGSRSSDDPVFVLSSQLGVRMHWTEALDVDWLDGWFDVHHVFTSSGGIARHGFDLGTGAGFVFGPSLAVGPFVRMTYSSDPLGDDPLLVTFGAYVSVMPRLRGGVEREDTDGDGFPDEDDVCPDEHAGGYASTENPGCPTHDLDGDGWRDDLDECPTEPAGALPDDEHPGCPLPDRDGDGVTDTEDQCPRVPAGDHPDPFREGCPGTSVQTVPDDGSAPAPKPATAGPGRGGVAAIRVDGADLRDSRGRIRSTGPASGPRTVGSRAPGRVW